MKWMKSSRCKTDSPMCVEVYGLEAEYISIRNSTVPHTIVSLTREEWSEFVDGVKRGEFDLKTSPELDAEEQVEQV